MQQNFSSVGIGTFKTKKELIVNFQTVSKIKKRLYNTFAYGTNGEAWFRT